MNSWPMVVCGRISTGETNGSTTGSKRGAGNRTLLWLVSLWCEGEGVPDDPGDARSWLLEHGEVIRSGFLGCASDLEAERDIDPDPPVCVQFSWNRFAERVPGVEMHIHGSKNRTLCSLPLPCILREVAANWRPRIEALEADERLS